MAGYGCPASLAWNSHAPQSRLARTTPKFATRCCSRLATPCKPSIPTATATPGCPAVKVDKDYSKEDFCGDFGIEWLVVISLNEDWVSTVSCGGGCYGRRLRGLRHGRMAAV